MLAEPEREGGSQFATHRRWEVISRLLRYLRVELASLRQTAPASSEIRRVEGQNSRMSETSFPRHKLRIPINARILMLHSVHPSIKIPKYQYVEFDFASWTRCGKRWGEELDWGIQW